jgi:ankyrin repeat protein
MTKELQQNATVENQDMALEPKQLIWEAAVDEEWHIIKEWLQRDPSLVNVTGEYNGYNNLSLLHLAIEYRQDVDFVKYLVSLGANVNAKNDNDWTPLYLTNSIEILKYLVSQGAEVHVKDNDGKTLLHNAVEHNANIDVLKYIISQGADVNARDNTSKTPLHWATGHFTSLKKLQFLVSMGADVNAKDDSGNTPLHKCDINPDKVKYLISRGADINARDNDGKTPLHKAAEYNSNKDVLKCLISHGADIHAKDNGKTPLDYAYSEEAKYILRDAVA